MNLIQRVQDILLKPKPTWLVIEQEPADVASIYKEYLIYLAAIPALASFIGMSLVGMGAFGYSVRLPVVSGLVNMIIGYVLSLGGVFVLALIVDALAPTFNGIRSRINAVKLVAFGATASFVGGIFWLIPALSILGLLVGLYSIYLIYTGLPLLMKCPPAKAGAYTAVVLVCGFVVGMVLGLVLSFAMPSRGLMGSIAGNVPSGGDMTIRTPGGEVNIDTSQMAAMASKMEEAGKRMEASQKAGDPAAAGKAVSDILGAMTGTGGTPIAAQELKAMLPESLGDLKRESFEAQGGQAMGIAGSSAEASYVAGPKRVQLSITDMGGLAGLATMAGWAGMTSDRETNTEIERVYKQGARTVREESRKDGSHAEVTVILKNGVLVEARGDKVNVADLKGMIEGLNPSRIEAMTRATKQ